MKKVVWGILSTARIGTVKVVPAMQKSASIDVRAIASRSEAAARRAAGELRIPRAYGSYEALRADPEIEAVYNPLPNHLHVPLTLKAVSGRFLFETEPRRAVALVDRDATLRTDRTTSALVDFGQGRQLSFTVSTQCVLYQRGKGRLEVVRLFVRASIVGIVEDSTGAVLPGVTVEASSPC